MALLHRRSSAADPEGAEHRPRAVVVPIDGTPTSMRAVPFATQLAADLAVELVVVSVINPFRPEAEDRVARLRDLLADLPAPIERRVVHARFVSRAIADETTDAIVCVATSAEPVDDDGFRYSVTDQLVATATSPVVVIGPRCEPERTVDRIVVGVDPDHDQAGLAYWSTMLGYQLSVPVDFVHIAHDVRLDLPTKVRPVTAAPDESLGERLLAESQGALLAIGSHGHTGFQRLLEGSMGAAIIPTSTQPLLVLGPHVARPR